MSQRLRETIKAKYEHAVTRLSVLVSYILLLVIILTVLSVVLAYLQGIQKTGTTLCIIAICIAGVSLITLVIIAKNFAMRIKRYKFYIKVLDEQAREAAREEIIEDEWEEIKKQTYEEYKHKREVATHHDENTGEQQ